MLMRLICRTSVLVTSECSAEMFYSELMSKRQLLGTKVILWLIIYWHSSEKLSSFFIDHTSFLNLLIH